MKGINKERIVNYEIIELLDNYIYCAICNNICYQPYTCIKCEANTCKYCLGINIKCPKCDCEELKYFHQILQIFFKSLKIKCININCEEILDYNDLVSHEALCSKSLKTNNSSSFMKSFENIELEVSKQKEDNEIEEIEKNNNNNSNINNYNEDNICSEINSMTIDSYQELENENYNYQEYDSLAFDKFSDNFIQSIHIESGSEYELKDKEDEKEFDNFTSQEKTSIINNLKSRVVTLEKICEGLIKEKHIKSGNAKLNGKNPQNDMTIQQQQNMLSNRATNQNNTQLEKCDLCSIVVAKKSKIKCNKCLRFACLSCNVNCSNCVNTTCVDCSKCVICKLSKECIDCKSSCAQCIKTEPAFCIGCVSKCSLCENKFCKRCCAFTCKECGVKACLKCSWNCRICLSTFCNQTNSIVCKACGVKTCLMCIENCNSCERTICKYCVGSCGKCKDLTCMNCCVKSPKKDITCKKCLTY